MNAELVSAVIPAYNAQETVAATIASVVAQTYRRMEVIVVDDGSHDATAELVRNLALGDPRIRLVRQSNQGSAAARNAGIEHARGDYIAPLDADDLWHPTKIEKQMNVMRQRGPRVGLVYCWSRAIDGQMRILFDLPSFSYRGDVFAPLILHNFITSGAPLFRRRVALDAGGYDVSLAAWGARLCEDLKFNLDMAECCDFDLVPEYLFGYMLRHGSRSKNTIEMHHSRCIVIDQARITHPELPGNVFRWAHALNARTSSRLCLEAGQFRKALKLILEATAKDPVGALGPHARRTLISGLLGRMGLKDRVQAFFRHASGVTSAAQGIWPDISGSVSFLDADPTQPHGRPSPSWRSRRFRYVGHLRTARPQPVN